MVKRTRDIDDKRSFVTEEMIMRKWSLPQEVHKSIYKREVDKTLGYLSNLTSGGQHTLFPEDEESYRRYVGAFRVQLLMEWGYYREALAWTCLECELYPENMKAFIFKESIKKKIATFPESRNHMEPQQLSVWKGVAGMHELKATVERDIILPLKNKELYERFRVPIPNGYLFYGPPGCGKTYFAGRLAEHIGYDFMSIRPSDVGSIYVHGTQLGLNRVFSEARMRAPVLLFFDEFESMAPKRTDKEVDFHYKSETNELLTQLDGLVKSGILFIAASNYIRNIDDAILRPGRIDKKIFIGPPDFEARIEAYKMKLADRPVRNILFDVLAEMSENFTHADIEFVCNEATRDAINERKEITTDLLGKIISEYMPHLDEEKMKEYI